MVIKNVLRTILGMIMVFIVASMAVALFWILVLKPIVIVIIVFIAIGWYVGDVLFKDNI